MYDLLLDIGNSFVKIALISGNSFERLQSLPLSALNEDGFVESLEMPSRPCVWVVSVAAESKTSAFFANLRTHGCRKIYQFKPSHSLCGITTNYERPEKLGGDRFLGMVAARRRHKKRLVVANLGTAITIDALDANGCHKGGLIMPGFAMALKALQDGADHLNISLSAANNVELLAKNSAQCMFSGCALMIRSAVQKIVRDLQAALGGDAAVLASGGDARLALDALSGEVNHCPLLVLEGLAICGAGEKAYQALLSGLASTKP